MAEQFDGVAIIQIGTTPIDKTLKEHPVSLVVKPVKSSIKTNYSDDVKKEVEMTKDVSLVFSIPYSVQDAIRFPENVIIQDYISMTNKANNFIIDIPQASIVVSHKLVAKNDQASTIQFNCIALKLEGQEKINIGFFNEPRDLKGVVKTDRDIFEETMTGYFVASIFHSSDGWRDVLDGVEWFSSNEGSLVIGFDGRYSCFESGISQIYFTYNGIISSRMNIEVRKQQYVSLVLDPSDDVRVNKGEQLQFKATGHYLSGATKDATNEVEWKTTDSEVVNITETEMSIFRRGGTSKIYATLPYVESNPTTVTVLSDEILYIRIANAESMNVKIGVIQTISVEGYSSLYGWQPLTDGFILFSSNTTVVSVNGNQITTVGEGYSSITAGYEGLFSTNEKTVNVSFHDLLSIRANPESSTSIQIGETLQFTAMGTYEVIGEIELRGTQEWSLANTDIAEIDSHGLLPGKAFGTIGVVLKSGSFTAPSVLVYVEDSVVRQVRIVTPDKSEYKVGEQVTFVVETFSNSTGWTTATEPITWKTNNNIFELVSGNTFEAKSIGSINFIANVNNIDSPIVNLSVFDTKISDRVILIEALLADGTPIPKNSLVTRTYDIRIFATYDNGSRIEVTNTCNIITGGMFKDIPNLSYRDKLSFRGNGEAYIIFWYDRAYTVVHLDISMVTDGNYSDFSGNIHPNKNERITTASIMRPVINLSYGGKSYNVNRFDYNASFLTQNNSNNVIYVAYNDERRGFRLPNFVSSGSTTIAGYVRSHREQESVSNIIASTWWEGGMINGTETYKLGSFKLSTQSGYNILSEYADYRVKIGDLLHFDATYIDHHNSEFNLLPSKITVSNLVGGTLAEDGVNAFIIDTVDHNITLRLTATFPNGSSEYIDVSLEPNNGVVPERWRHYRTLEHGTAYYPDPELTFRVGIEYTITCQGSNDNVTWVNLQDHEYKAFSQEADGILSYDKSTKKLTCLNSFDGTIPYYFEWTADGIENEIRTFQCTEAPATPEEATELRMFTDDFYITDNGTEMARILVEGLVRGEWMDVSDEATVLSINENVAKVISGTGGVGKFLEMYQAGIVNLRISYSSSQAETFYKEVHIHEDLDGGGGGNSSSEFFLTCNGLDTVTIIEDTGSFEPHISYEDENGNFNKFTGNDDEVFLLEPKSIENVSYSYYSIDTNTISFSLTDSTEVGILELELTSHGVTTKTKVKIIPPSKEAYRILGSNFNHQFYTGNAEPVNFEMYNLTKKMWESSSEDINFSSINPNIVYNSSSKTLTSSLGVGAITTIIFNKAFEDLHYSLECSNQSHDIHSVKLDFGVITAGGIYAIPDGKYTHTNVPIELNLSSSSGDCEWSISNPEYGFCKRNVMHISDKAKGKTIQLTLVFFEFYKFDFLINVN